MYKLITYAFIMILSTVIGLPYYNISFPKKKGKKERVYLGSP